jgi:hypothetical protein
VKAEYRKLVLAEQFVPTELTPAVVFGIKWEIYSSVADLGYRSLCIHRSCPESVQSIPRPIFKTNSVYRNPYWEADNRNRSTSQEIADFHGSQMAIYKTSPPVPILSHMNPIHIQYPIFLRSILILSSVHASSYEWSLSFRLSNQYSGSVSYFPNAPLISLHFIILMIFGEEYKSRIFLHPSGTCSDNVFSR